MWTAQQQSISKTPKTTLQRADYKSLGKLQKATRILAREYAEQETGYWHNYVLEKSHDDHVTYHVIGSI